MNQGHYDELKSLELELAKPNMRKNTSRIRELLSDDFEEYGSSGKVTCKSDFLASLGKSDSSAYELSNFMFTELGNNFTLVKYVSFVSGQRALRSSIWAKFDSRWQMLHHQSTVVPSAT